MFTPAGPSRHRQPQNLHTYGLSPFHENEELTPFPIIPNHNRWERRDRLDQEHVEHIHSRLPALSTQPATNYSDATRFSSIYNQPSINDIELHLRKSQEECNKLRTLCRQLQVENQDLKQELDVFKAQREPQILPPPRTPLEDGIEVAKPHFRRLVALYNPFVPPNMNAVKGKKPEPGILAGTTRFNPDKHKRPLLLDVFIAELYSCLPPVCRPIVMHDEFLKAYQETVRLFKGTLIDTLRDAAPIILEMNTDKERAYFKAKYNRSEVLDLVLLLSWLGDSKKVDFYPPILFPQRVRNLGKAEGFMRYIFQSPELFKFIKAFLFGTSSLKPKKDKSSMNNGKRYGTMWKISRIDQLPMNTIPVFAILMIFILSPDERFGSIGPTTKIDWRDRLESYMEDFYRLSVEKVKNYNQIMALFRSVVFQDDAPSDDFEDTEYDRSAIFNDKEEESFSESDQRLAQPPNPTSSPPPSSPLSPLSSLEGSPSPPLSTSTPPLPVRPMLHRPGPPMLSSSRPTGQAQQGRPKKTSTQPKSAGQTSAPSAPPQTSVLPAPAPSIRIRQTRKSSTTSHTVELPPTLPAAASVLPAPIRQTNKRSMKSLRAELPSDEIRPDPASPTPIPPARIPQSKRSTKRTVLPSDEPPPAYALSTDVPSEAVAPRRPEQPTQQQKLTKTKMKGKEKGKTVQFSDHLDVQEPPIVTNAPTPNNDNVVGVNRTSQRVLRKKQ